MRGDRVEIVIDAGGTSRTYEVTATKAGRRVEVVTGRGLVEVMEVTRGGTVVRTARFMSSRVLALVEHPAGRGSEPEDARQAGRAGAGRSAAAAAPARAPRTRPASPADPAGTGPPAGAHGAERAEPADADEPAGSGEPASMVEDAVERTAAQFG